MRTTHQTGVSWRRRRSQRIPLVVPLFVSSLDPKVKFSERCETTSVNRHGCRIQAPRPLQPDMHVRLDIPHTDRATTARVVHSEPVDPATKTCVIALELDEAENFWGVRFPPEDWGASARARAREEVAAKKEAARTGTAVEAPTPSPPVAPKARPEPSEPLPPPPATGPPAPAPPKAPVAPQPPAPTPATVRAEPARPVTPPSASATSVSPAAAAEAGHFEFILREKAKIIATEFEEDYRKRLGDLLVRLRADLEDRATGDWERLRQQAQQSLQEIATQLRQQIDEEAERRRQEATDVAGKLQALHELREQIETRLRTVGELLQEQVTQERDQLLRQTREELERLVSDLRQQVDQEVQRRVDASAGFQAELEEVRQVRDYVESLIRHLPQTVDQQVEKGVAGTLEQIRTRMQEEFTAQREAQTEELEQHLYGLSEQVGAGLRQKLLEDMDQHERDLLDRVNVHLEEVRALESTLREHMHQTKEELTRESEQLLSQLQARLSEQVASRLQEADARFEQKERKLHQRAEYAFRSLGEKTWSSLKQVLQATFDKRHQALQQALETARGETTRLATRAEELAARLDTNLESQLDQAVAVAAARARQQFEQTATNTQEQLLAAVKEQLDQTLAPLVSRGEATAYDLHQVLDSATNERGQLESQIAELRRQTEQAQTRLSQESEQGRRQLQEALTEAVGRAREEFLQAAEAARRERLETLQEQLDRIVAPLVNRGEATAAELRPLLDSLQKELGQLQSQTAEFRQEAEQARTWLAQETGQFQKLVHDALVEASGQIRGRIHQAIEMAEEPLTRRARELHTELDKLAEGRREEIARQLEETRERLRALEEEAKKSVDWMLEARLTAVLDQFQQRTEKLAQKSAGKLQASLNEALESISRILRDKLAPPS